LFFDWQSSWRGLSRFFNPNTAIDAWVTWWCLAKDW
jgi:hypothetical protein